MTEVIEAKITFDVVSRRNAIGSVCFFPLEIRLILLIRCHLIRLSF